MSMLISLLDSSYIIYFIVVSSNSDPHKADAFLLEINRQLQTK